MLNYVQVTLPNGKSVTPQEAFGAWYKGESIVRGVLLWVAPGTHK